MKKTFPAQLQNDEYFYGLVLWPTLQDTFTSIIHNLNIILDISKLSNQADDPDVLGVLVFFCTDAEIIQACSKKHFRVILYIVLEILILFPVFVRVRHLEQVFIDNFRILLLTIDFQGIQFVRGY
ncbi:hypothetical protein KQX54_016152 [Cotesia glomerata]|uniref:Uncharacterized protein n=1 Tax=Cotesia glomerata TaxID=32391 RepID=A0AAV7HZV0_COTGL|nr:hypothetical protein KQX54_016152 [Cotesia glomerata]